MRISDWSSDVCSSDLATPWDFDGFSDDQRETLQSLWESAQPTVDTLGLLPLEILQIAFWLLDPGRTVSKYARFGALPPGSPEADAFMRVEDWVNGGAPLPRGAARELVDDPFPATLPGQGRSIGRASCRERVGQC